MAATSLVVDVEARESCPLPNATDPCMHYVSVRAGLGNRMRAVTTYLAAARYLGCHLTVYWSSLTGEDELPVVFGDLFELPAAPDLHVLSPDDKSARKRMPDDSPTTYHIHPQTRAIFPLLGPLALRIFRPLPHILARVEQLLDSLGPSFVALHIRRTDKNSNYQDDVDLAKWAAKYSRSRVYAAVDNALSLETVRDALPPGRVIAQGIFVEVLTAAATHKLKAGSGRHTTFEAAVVDMWTASFAAHFRGTITSSYSVLIQQLRAGRNPTGELGIDTWVANCADTDDFVRILPPPFWVREFDIWPTEMAYTNVSAASAWKVGDDMCDKYRKDGIKQLY